MGGNLIWTRKQTEQGEDMKTEEEKEEAEIIKLIRLEFLKGGKRC